MEGLDAIAEKSHLKIQNFLNASHVHVSFMSDFSHFHLRKLIRSNTKACFLPNSRQTGQSTVEQSQSLSFVRPSQEIKNET